MRILLTNDDGIDAPGLNDLKKVLSKEHDVYVCAPMRQMSASGHSIHLFQAMELRRISEQEAALDGTPADCVKVALIGLFWNRHFDLLISGINDGPNMGDDIFYSGTVAAAREGAFNGLLSLACSRDGKGSPDSFEKPAEWIRKFISDIPESLLQQSSVLNINFPHKSPWTGWRETFPGHRLYSDRIVYETVNGCEYARIEGDTPGYHSREGSDLDAVAAGYISVSILDYTRKEGREPKLPNLSEKMT